MSLSTQQIFDIAAKHILETPLEHRRGKYFHKDGKPCCGIGAVLALDQELVKSVLAFDYNNKGISRLVWQSSFLRRSLGWDENKELLGELQNVSDTYIEPLPILIQIAHNRGLNRGVLDDAIAAAHLRLSS